MYQKSYDTAKWILGIVTIAGWLVLAAGIIASVSSFFGGGDPNLTVMTVGPALLTSGLVLLAASQVWLVVLDEVDISDANRAVLGEIADSQDVNLQPTATASAASTPSQMRTEPKLRHGQDDG